MASGKRASMREGPLAQLFRKTEEDDARPRASRARRSRLAEEERTASTRSPSSAARCPRVDRRRRSRRHVPEPQGQTERMTEAAKRAEEREAAASGARGRGYGRHEGIPTPEERLKAVFSHDIPENIMEREPVAGSARARCPSRSRSSAWRPTGRPSPSCVSSAWAARA